MPSCPTPECEQASTTFDLDDRPTTYYPLLDPISASFPQHVSGSCFARDIADLMKSC